MRRLTAWLSGAAGGIALYRLLRRRPAPTLPPAVPAAGPDPRAEELRARLEQQEAAAPAEEPALEPEPEPEPAAEPAPEPVAADDPDERRRRVHERARAAADEMRRSARP